MPESYSAFYLANVLVQPSALQLSSKDAVCRVEPKVMALLVALAERPGELCQRDELFSRLWPGSSASDEALTRLVYQVRKALRSVAGPDEALHTVSGQGFRLDADIWFETVTPKYGAHSHDRLAPFSVAVLPIVDSSSTNKGKFLADGLTRDLTSLLARTPRLHVAPHSSASRFSPATSTASTIGEALGCRFIASGSLVRQGRRVRIRVALEDTLDNALIWAEKYETELDNFFEVEEDVVCQLSTAIAVKINTTQPTRLKRTGKFQLSAYERVQEAEGLRNDYGPENAKKIVATLQEALRIEPEDPITRAALAVQLSQNVVSLWADDPAATIEEADALIAEALAMAPSDPEVLASAGIVATMFHRPDTAIELLEIATARNPNDAHAMAVLGWQCSLRYADSAGVELIRTAEERAPHHPRFGLWATYRATSHLFLLNHADGLAAAQQACRRTPQYYQPHLTCAWAYAGLKDAPNTKRAVARAHALADEGIEQKFVEEMRRWSSNSPNRQAIWRVLDRLVERCA